MQGLEGIFTGPVGGEKDAEISTSRFYLYEQTGRQ